METNELRKLAWRFYCPSTCRKEFDLLQNHTFYAAKGYLLHGKTYPLGMQNVRFEKVGWEYGVLGCICGKMICVKQAM